MTVKEGLLLLCCIFLRFYSAENKLSHYIAKIIKIKGLIMLKNVLLGLSLSVASLGANAALITNHSFESESGNMAVTLDTTTGIEWLRTSYTSGDSYNDVLARLDGDLSGWRLPTEDEVRNLLVSNYSKISPESGGRYSFTSYGNGTAEYRTAGYVMSYILGSSSSNLRYSGTASYGLYVDDNDEINSFGFRKDGSFYFRTVGMDNGVVYDEDYSHSYVGYFLVSDGGLTVQSIANPSLNAENENSPFSVPVPFALGGLALMALFASRKQKKNI